MIEEFGEASATIRSKYQSEYFLKADRYLTCWLVFHGWQHKLIDQMLRPSPEERPDASELISELDRYTNILNADRDNKTI